MCVARGCGKELKAKESQAVVDGLHIKSEQEEREKEIVVS